MNTNKAINKEIFLIICLIFIDSYSTTYHYSMLNNIDNCKYSFLKYNQHRIMRINKKLITFVLSLFLITSCSFLVEKQTTDSNTLRKIESGEIIGMDNGETYQWLGIPYGSVSDSN